MMIYVHLGNKKCYEELYSIFQKVKDLFSSLIIYGEMFDSQNADIIPMKLDLPSLAKICLQVES